MKIYRKIDPGDLFLAILAIGIFLMIMIGDR